MTRHFTHRRVAVFWSMMKWLPVLAIPFGVFFFETWLQVRIIEHGYSATDLRRKMKDVTAHIGRLQERADELTALKRISERAPDLGLTPIQPGQVEIVYAPPAPDRDTPATGQSAPLAIANADLRHGAR